MVSLGNERSQKNVRKAKKRIKKYIAVIRKSKYFDAEWYKQQYPEVVESGLHPAEYYMLQGWQKKHNPSKGFDGNKYLENNPDVREAGLCPLCHYEQYGKYENRNLKGVLVPDLYKSYGVWYSLLRWLLRGVNRKRILQNKRARILVHLHMFYPDSWVEIREYMENLSIYNYHLVVTYADVSGMNAVIEEIRSYKPDTVVSCTPNKGFDVGPFIEVLTKINLDEYDIIYHVHSKHVLPKNAFHYVYGRAFNGSSWFRQLYSGIFGVRNVHLGIDYLLNAEDCGMIGGENLLFDDSPAPAREKAVREYAERLGIEMPESYTFVAGTCFGIRPEYLKWIKEKGITMESFKPSERGVVTTLAHAMERIIPAYVLSKGAKIYPMPTCYDNHIDRVKRRDKEISAEIQKKRQILEKLGIENPEPLEMEAVSSLRSSFWKGRVNGREAFIKMGNIKHLLRVSSGRENVMQLVTNEAEMQCYARENMPQFVPEVLMYDSENVVIAMEMIRGSDLTTLINLGMAQAEKDRVIAALNGIRAGLAKAGILHRDIRPANIMVTDDAVYLIDYQFAVHVQADGSFQELGFLINSPRVRAALGDKYRAHTDGWDDGISLDMVIQSVLQA